MMSARVGVVLFPGTNCELDVQSGGRALGGEAELLWHGDRTVRGVDAVVVPGGFAHGDYLRTGAIARFSPVMDAVAEFAAGGGPVVGICNGFQVLTEAGLLPGALQKNAGLTFVCDTVELEVESTRVGAHQPRRARRRAAHPDQPLRGQLRLRRRDAGRAPGRGPHRGALRGEPQRQPRRHRRHLQRGRQRGRPHAPPRARQRRPARQRRRRRAARVRCSRRPRSHGRDGAIRNPARSRPS